MFDLANNLIKHCIVGNQFLNLYLRQLWKTRLGLFCFWHQYCLNGKP